MSKITERITAYSEAGSPKADWPALRDYLVNFKYKPTKRYADPQPEPGEERDWDYTNIDGSWDEMDRARRAGQLTKDEFYEVATARNKAGK